ncbi:hypothetical protein [Erwinia rhapontici]|uniref:hypothetical protein n=1 Tax=Erwinia rhapontici TaxID=55212 RepID=UPI00105B2728|nr:hypothetical protein [Erwinia rhapontici]TDS89593.1 hypothetical protein EDF84_11540 [Erwinia rhapontici]
MKRIVGGFWRMLLLSLLINPAFGGVTLVTTDVAYGYRDCQMVDNGNGTSTVKAVVKFKTSSGRTNNLQFLGRGVLFYNYSSSGVLVSVRPNSAFMDGLKLGNYSGDDYIVLYNVGLKGMPFDAEFKIIFNNSIVESWPGVVIRAANVTVGFTDVADITGGVYISRNSVTCQTISDPTHPPARDIILTVTAPDWDLGEIKSGEQVIPLSASSEKLCMRYNGGGAARRLFIVTASSKNGTVNNKYQLKNIQDNSQSIPYQLTLDSGTSKVDLPNNSFSTLQLLEDRTSCFLPTFRTFAPEGIKNGDYSDVLTFNVVTRA